MGYPYVVMVMMPPPDGDMALYQVADVLVSINGQPVYGVDSYGNTAQWELRASAVLLPHYAVLP